MSALAPAGHFNTLGVEGLEDLDQSDFILPRWSIVQPTSKREDADDHLGQFVRNIDGEFRPSIDAVLLKVNQSRILWSGDLNDKHPECVSRDGLTGSVYGACAKCQFNTLINPGLRTDSNAKRCNFGYTVILIDDLDAGSMALFGAMGTSVRPMKVLTTQIMQRRRPLFSWVVRFETEKITNDRGKFYVLKASLAKQLDDADTAIWRDLYHSLAGAAIRDYDEAQDGEEAPPPF